MRHRSKRSIIVLCLAVMCTLAACSKDVQTDTEVTPAAEVTATVAPVEDESNTNPATETPEPTEAAPAVQPHP